MLKPGRHKIHKYRPYILGTFFNNDDMNVCPFLTIESKLGCWSLMSLISGYGMFKENLPVMLVVFSDCVVIVGVVVVTDIVVVGGPVFGLASGL